MNEYDSTVVEKKRGLPGWAIWAIVLVAVFLLGFVPMWWQYRQANKAHLETQKLLRKSEQAGKLTTAIVEARNGEYETARRNLSDFYTALNAETEKGDDSYLTSAQTEKVKAVFANRDNNITLLAQRDPAAGERLTDVYKIYKNAVGIETLPSASPSAMPANVSNTANTSVNAATNSAGNSAINKP